MNRIAVLYSGGWDSTVAAFLAKAASPGVPLHLVNIHYGHAAGDQQQKTTKEVADYLGATFSLLEYDYRPYYAGGLDPNPPELPKVFVHGAKPVEHDRDYLTESVGQLSEFPDFCWLEGRNAMFMLMAATDAIYHGCNRMFTGFQYNQVEQSLNDTPVIARGCDTTRHIEDTMNLVLFQSFSRSFRIESPLKGMYKNEIVELGKLLVPKPYLDMTHSCEYYPACGICSQCKERPQL